MISFMFFPYKHAWIKILVFAKAFAKGIIALALKGNSTIVRKG